MNSLASWKFVLPKQFVDEYGVEYGPVIEVEMVKTWLKMWTKKWVFQLEQGEKNGYIHYQGKVSLVKKRRGGEMHNLCKIESPDKTFYYAQWQPTVTENIHKFNYEMKADTRIDGPWLDTDQETFVVDQIAMIKKLYPWQQAILNSPEIKDFRTVNCIIDPIGGVGKTTLSHWCRAYSLARVFSTQTDTKDILRIVCDAPTMKIYIFDMQRSIITDKNVRGLFAAIESIKDGYAYDERFHFKEKIFNSPAVWVFCNHVPHSQLLSADRWRLWQINSATKELEPYQHQPYGRFATESEIF